MGYPSPPGDEIKQLLTLIDQLRRRISELERPDGSQTANALQTLTDLVNGLLEQVNGIFSGYVTAGTSISAGGNGTIGGTLNVTGAIFTPHGLANPVTSGYFAAYINGDARIGRSVSSRRYKTDIQRWNPSAQAIFGLELVTYRLKTAVEELGDAAPIEVGLIAEELVELGLGWLVLYVDGKVEGVAYEKIALAMLPTLHDHERRLSALEGTPASEPRKDFLDHEYHLAAEDQSQTGTPPTVEAEPEKQ